jgi:hypothetical protein
LAASQIVHPLCSPTVVERSLALVRPPPIPHYSGLWSLTLMDVKRFLQVIEIPSHGPIANTDVYFTSLVGNTT